MRNLTTLGFDTFFSCSIICLSMLWYYIILKAIYTDLIFTLGVKTSVNIEKVLTNLDIFSYVVSLQYVPLNVKRYTTCWNNQYELNTAHVDVYRVIL